MKKESVYIIIGIILVIIGCWIIESDPELNSYNVARLEAESVKEAADNYNQE